MINWLSNLWLNYQLKVALKKGQETKTKKILRQLESDGKSSYIARIYQQQLKLNDSLTYYRQENRLLIRRLQQVTPDNYFIKPQLEFIDYIYQSFKLKDIDASLIQSTGIDQEVFTALENALVEFLTTEINKVPEAKRDRELAKAIADLTGLKQGVDPEYNCRLTPHVYMIKYLLDNIYCVYLAWFLIYEQGLLKKSIKVLDIAAGPGTSIFGLALLLESLQKFSRLSLEQISYYSLEQQADFQYRGLQFWRRYIESLAKPINAYFSFNTANLFDYQNYGDRLPKQFFDFIIISHCFFYESELRYQSNQIYQHIFRQQLNHNGRVLLIVQGKKLFDAYDISVTEDKTTEEQLIQMFLKELGLKLDWYKYLSCTGKRTPNKTEFGKFAKNNLPPQKHISQLSKTYLQQHYVSHYAIDDYVILAKLSQDR